MNEASNLSYNELKEIYHSYQNEKKSEHADAKELEEKVEELKQEISELNNEIAGLQDDLEDYEKFPIPDFTSLHDELKWEIIMKAFFEYDLDELENRLDLSYVDYPIKK